MAYGRVFDNSVIIEDHFSFNQEIDEHSMVTSTPAKQSNLIEINDELVWNGSYENLKLFIQSDLGIEGQWKSTGGEVKKFTSKNYVLKWHSKTKQKLVVFQDDENQSLRQKLVKFASLNKAKNRDEDYHDEHLSCSKAEENSNPVKITQNPSTNVNEHERKNLNNADNFSIETPHAKSGHKFDNSQCYCCDLALQLKRIESDILQLKNRADEDTQVCKISACENEKVHLRNNLEKANSIIKDLNTKIINLEQEKTDLVTALTLQQNDYQACLNNLNQKNTNSAEMSNNFQVVQKDKNCNRKQQASEISSTSHTLNVDNRFQTLSDISDNETQTEIRAGNYPKGNEINPTNDQEESTNVRQKKGKSPETHVIGSDILIIGDSIIKNIQPRKLSKKKVHKFTYPGKTADQIEMEINFDKLKAIPSHVILHAGTNNLPLESAAECSQKIEKLATKVKSQFPYSKIGLSGLTVRHDLALSRKIDEVNKELELICTKLDISFIDNSTIDDTCLNGSKLHLNAKGSAILAVHLINFLRGSSGPASSQKQLYQDFQSSTIQKLGELLKIIVQPQKDIRRRKR
ncbi:uncharacterized protein LOC114532034 [Dendronephthya gigantea]|uniref:uncharacterized protein LOC114532034 n=1 Tax=Dendronephthya gigantea TaxID=151771 RepID=UPI00106A6779|nr:uncharacterized protein LOC114532034 [Dendronephthya gigantea]